jgi:hypothetical protein
MPLCHWPCSCYPNHAVGQTNDWMNEIYERWAAAHGIVIVTPVYWYQVPSALKLMIASIAISATLKPYATSHDELDRAWTSGRKSETLRAPWCGRLRTSARGSSCAGRGSSRRAQVKRRAPAGCHALARCRRIKRQRRR